MNNLREALSQMWDQRDGEKSFVRTKLSDLLALLSAFAAIAVTIALTALGDASVLSSVLGWFGVQDFPGLGFGLRVAAIVVSVLVSWLLFTWMIARLPRESISFRSSVRPGCSRRTLRDFKQVASVYLRSVMHGPAGAPSVRCSA